MNTDQKSEDKRIWDCATGVQNLLFRRTSKRYYSRIMVGGQRALRSLRTDDFQVAKLRHTEETAKAQRQRQTNEELRMGKGNMGMLIDKLESEYLSDTTKAKRSKAAFVNHLRRLVRQWQTCFSADLRTMKPTRVTLDHARRFANYLHSRARHYKLKGVKPAFGYTATTVNSTIEVLYRVLRLAVETGAAPALPFELNPVSGGPVLKPEFSKKPILPSTAQMRAIFSEMRRVPDGSPNLWELRHYFADRCAESAEFAEFMCFSGARKSEAWDFMWEDDLPDHVIIRGTKSVTSRDREVPKIAALRECLERMRARRLASGRELKGRAFLIRSCSDSLTSACEVVGVPRITHHGLRHFFATICIEAGVDIPTVSRWLGHGDGGVLAMKTYGHLRREHSLAAAAKVRVA